MTDFSRDPSNGRISARVGVLATAGGAPGPYDDPLSKVLGLDPHSSSVVAWLGYMLGAIALLLGLSVVVRVVGVLVALTNVAPAQISTPQEIEVEEAPPPPPPPEPPPPEQKQEAEPPPKPVAHETPPPPAAAPAQAAKVLTQEPDPNEPVDLTGNTIITGNAEAYAGGITSTNGTSKTAVRGLASPTGVPGGSGPPAALAAKHAEVDQHHHASTIDHDWSDVPFPPEADTAQIDDAYVTLQVDVRADGSIADVRVTKDPGNGFGREAKRYAPKKRFQPALDRDGNPVADSISVVVHFSR